MDNREKIISEAAAWVIRVEAGMSGAEQDAFLDWLTADSSHAAEYERQTAQWARLDILADWRPEHAARPNRDLLAPRRESFFQWIQSRRRMLTGAAFGLAGAAAAACVAFAILGRSDVSNSATDNTQTAVYAASDTISNIEQNKLDDGTIVELNRGASISVMYTATERYVVLNQGEVNFHVAKDPTRPFIVNIDGVNVRALGTSFNVRRQGGAVEVLVTSGVVQVNTEGESAGKPTASSTVPKDAFVKAGQLAVVSLALRSPSLSVQNVGSDKMENMIAWHPRQLDISEQPLSSVIEEFNRRNAPIQLVIADPELAKIEVSTTMRSDQVESFVRLLEGDFRVKAERAGNQVALHRRDRS